MRVLFYVAALSCGFGCAFEYVGFCCAFMVVGLYLGGILVTGCFIKVYMGIELWFLRFGFGLIDVGGGWLWITC